MFDHWTTISTDCGPVGEPPSWLTAGDMHAGDGGGCAGGGVPLGAVPALSWGVLPAPEPVWVSCTLMVWAAVPWPLHNIAITDIVWCMA